MFECCVGNAIEDARFPGHALEIVEIGGFDPAFGTLAHAMDDLDQQGHQGIGDFLGALIHQGRQQGHTNGLGMFTNMGRGFSGDAPAQAFYQPGCVPSKQIRW